ncbi:hypothetical protein CEP51_012509, partial [Fusarium floridanum]
HNNLNTHTFSSPTAIRGGGGSGDKHYEDSHDERQHERQDGSELAGSGRDDPCQYEPPVEIQDGETSTWIDPTPGSNCSSNRTPEPVLDVQPISRGHNVLTWVKAVAEHTLDIEGFEGDQRKEREQLEMAQGRAKERRFEMAQLEMEQRNAKEWFETAQSLEGERLETKQKFALPENIGRSMRV